MRSGETWFLEFDPPTSRKGRPARSTVATKIFWALGYNQVESFLTTFDPKRVEIDPKATIRRPSGARTRFTHDDINAILERVARNADGTYRVVAGRLIPGKILGGFLYAGTRPDDPNDLVPHEHRRELRALRVFGAWTNLTDLKAANTLDALVTENGRIDRQTLPAGRRLDVRHVQRPARMGSQLGILLPGRYDAAPPLLVRLCAEPVADGSTTSSTRRSASSRAIASIPERGGRRRRRRPTWRCVTTTRSGRRDGSRHSPTT